jgi:hypothetical protein
MKKSVSCKICYITDNTGTGDLDSYIHKGFTIGNGKQLYWMMTWHGSGHVTVYSNDDKPLRRRWINGDTIITIHWK